MSDSIGLIKVDKTEEHVSVLYEFVINRDHNISNTILPSYEEHKKFVHSHPYRCWYLIRKDSQFIGAIYLLKSNNIGASTISGCEKYIGQAIQRLVSKYKPLPAIKSVRASVFSINTNPENYDLILELEKLGAKLIQQTYVLKQ